MVAYMPALTLFGEVLAWWSTAAMIIKHLSQKKMTAKITQRNGVKMLESLIKKFNKIGAQAIVKPGGTRWPGMVTNPAPITIDVEKGKTGEQFVINTFGSDDIDLNVMDVDPKKRHLLMLLKHANSKVKYLCGHDERHWFVSVIGNNTVSTVDQAMEALKPATVRQLQVGVRKTKKNNTHKNKASVGNIPRQGEWYFVPAPGVTVDTKLILRNEPLRRNMGGKPHVCEEMYRTGGKQVWVSGINIISQAEYARLTGSQEKRIWRATQADTTMLVRGRITHPDHSTVRLNCWHRVMLNEEAGNAARFGVRFLD